MPTPFPELEPYLPGARQPRKPSTSTAPSTWLDREMERQRDEQIRDGLLSAPAPDAVARTERVARDTGSSIVDVQGNEDAAERGLQVRKMVDMASQYPAIGKWAAQNPRGAAMATDDYDSLSALGKAWDWVKKGAASLRTGIDVVGGQGARINASIADTVNALYAQLDAIAQPGRLTVGEMERRRAQSGQYWDSGVAEADATAERHRPQYNGYLQQQIIGSLEYVPASLGAGIVGAVTRSPSLATGLMASGVGGSSYYDARKAGLSGPEALRYGVAQGGTEYLTEMVPAGTLVQLISSKSPFGKTFLRELGQEVAGENVATIVQDLTDWAYLPENRDKTFGDYLKDRPQAALDTTISTVSMVGATGGIVGAAHRATNATASVAGRVREARQARAERAALEEMGAREGAPKQVDRCRLTRGIGAPQP